MNILETVEKTLLPRLRAWDAKDFFNRILTETKGEIPPYFYPLEIWGENRGFQKGIDFSNLYYREMFWHASMTYCWQITKPEYQIPSELLADVLDSEFNGKLPLTVLKTIPHWTGYVDLSACPIKHPLPEEPLIEGIFLSTVTHWSGKEGLTIVYPYNDGGFPQTLFFPFDEGLTLEEVIASDPTIIRAAKEHNLDAEAAADILMRDGYRETYTKLLNVALFVAQEYDQQDAADFRNTFRLTKMKRSGKHYSLRFLNAHRKFPVGFDYLEEMEKRKKGQKTHGRAAHIRRAHWHYYLVGKRDAERKYILKWLKAIVVSGGKNENHT